MTQAVQEEEQGSRHRPASLQSTHERALLYGRLSRLVLAVNYVLLLVFLLSGWPQVPFLGVASPLNGVVPGWVGGLLFAAIAVSTVGYFILRKKARRHAQPRFVNLESPPGVLFLRPFVEDTDWRVYASWGADRHGADVLQPRAFLAVLKFKLRMQWRVMRGQEGYEFGEFLSELTRDLGHVAAIGEPGSPPIMGADNVYVADDGWQDKVLAMARGAKLVILTASTSPGVLWETENMLRIVPPSRFLLNIPGMTPARRRKHYAAFREVAGHHFPRGLPSELKARVIAFNPDWSPVEDLKRQPPPGTSAHVAWWMSRVLP